MKTRRAAATARRRSAADFLVTPPPGAAKASNESSQSPKSFEFKLNSPPITTTAAASRRKSAPPAADPSPTRLKENVSSIDELKELASSKLDSIKRQAERSHSDILKEVEAFHSRLHKRFKIQAQACEQMMGGIDKEFKKMSERITESCEAMKESYDEFMVEAQTTATRVCKTSIPEKVQSLEKAIDALQAAMGLHQLHLKLLSDISWRELQQADYMSSQTSWKNLVDILHSAQL